MPCAENEHIVICRPTLDAWRRCFLRCPVCKTRRLCLGEFQDYYGERWTCLTCGMGWMDGEYRKPWKRERAQIVASAKARIKEYIDAGIAQGFQRYMAKLDAELSTKKTKALSN